jgi:hypothetical protein
MEMALMKKEEPALRKMAQKSLGATKERTDQIADQEIRAIAFSEYARNKASGTGLAYGIRRFFDRMINIFRRIRNAMQGYGFKTSQDFFDAAIAGKVKERPSRREQGLGSRMSELALDSNYKNEPTLRNEAIAKYRKQARIERAAGGRVEAANIDHNPTEGQKEAGNYRHDHLHVQGLNISIENAKGSYRHGIDKDGNPWKSKIPAHYGYLKTTEGADGDHVDCYLGPHLKSPHVFIVDQLNAETGKFDEHKCFIGFPSKFAAINAFHEAFSDGKAGKRFGHIHEMSMDEFKAWLKDGNTKKPVRYKEAA